MEASRKMDAHFHIFLDKVQIKLWPLPILTTLLTEISFIDRWLVRVESLTPLAKSLIAISHKTYAPI